MKTATRHRFFPIENRWHSGKESGYCPYCGRCNLDRLTEEHVIPKSIGGDRRTLIFICKRCNDTSGYLLDALLRKDPWIAFLATSRGRRIQSRDRVCSVATLKDGLQVEGVFSMEPTSETTFSLGFRPKSVQSDGNRWTHEDSVADLERLPESVNVFRRSRLHMVSLSIRNPASPGLERAMAKILLGLSYGMHGRSVLEDPGFDILRTFLKLGQTAGISCSWDHLSQLPYWCEVPALCHVAWGSVDPVLGFDGGVSLFGKIGVRIWFLGPAMKSEGKLIIV